MSHYSVDDLTCIDSTVSCSRCDAVCCRLTVMVMPEDRGVPRHMVTRNDAGQEVMARDEDGWCVAVDHRHMRCGIYHDRPGVCRKFAMGSAYCIAERENYARGNARTVALKLI